MNVRLTRLQGLVVACALVAASCGPEGLQRQDQFAWAIKEGVGSTSPPVVRVKLSELQTNTSSIRCVFSDSLVKAIIAENSLPLSQAGYDKAISIALASHDHSFRFVRPAARKEIAETGGLGDEELSKACKLIEQGKSALWADYPGIVVEGPRFPLEKDTKY